MYTISEISRLTDTSAHTIRYYEKEELLFPKRQNGQRRYDDQDVTWLRFVLRLRVTHMPIEQIRSYVTLFLAHGEQDTTQERLALLEAHHANVLAQLAALQETERMIAEKVDTYRLLHPTIPSPDVVQSSENASVN
ncbi:MerR family transcriptional regulator [Exiguobacterium sp. U13-1]|uniref:MerR family transcriptional regulator n=1 Tax=Exiguobacterium acetylicum TaxID=41170 RepID=A0ABX8GDV2_EXIAC|nr:MULTISPECIES: MerR family transcriptional regulator [Exiguobacterium]AOT00564.1 MerR family transcriptional regulator [Exiguobacterium sp. U13-1]QWB31531.1 MerR family transcriptional regulator [Exiguobacterium acetylicum]